jgi:hypothetical protein
MSYTLDKIYTDLSEYANHTQDFDALSLTAEFSKFKEAYTKFNDDKTNYGNWRTAMDAKDNFNNLFNTKIFDNQSLKKIMKIASNSKEFREIEFENPNSQQKGGKKRRTTHRKSLKKSKSKRLNKLFKRSKRSKRSKTRKHYM